MERIEELYRSYKLSFPGVPDVRPAELDAFRARDPIVLVDVREPEERAVSVLPGAISREEYEARRGELGDRTVVAYCTIGYRSGVYVAELRRAGVDARNLAGSVLAWTHAGKPLVDGVGTTRRRVHVYGSDWNLVADGYEAVW